MPRRGLNRVGLTVAAVILTTGVAVAHGSLAGRLPAVGLAAVVGFYLLVSAIITGFAVWTAGSLGMPTFLFAEPSSTRRRLGRLLLHGVGMGVLLSVASAVLAGAASGGALRPWFWRQIQTPSGVVLLSANAALLEETFFRLFMIPFLVSVVARMRRERFSLRIRGGRAEATSTRPAPSRWVIFGAVLVSSVMFGLAHRFNPLPAALLGPFLAHSYLRGGWESAVVAHFVADLLVLSFLL